MVIFDITRPVPNQIILPPMLNILEESGIKREYITILIAARDILKKGGTIVVVCECREGLGNPEFCGIMTSVCSPQEFFDGYCDPKNFVIDQWCAQNIYQALSHAGQVYIYSPGLSQADLEKTGAIEIESVQETVDKLLDNHANVVAVPKGPYVVGICNK